MPHRQHSRRAARAIGIAVFAACVGALLGAMSGHTGRAPFPWLDRTGEQAVRALRRWSAPWREEPGPRELRFGSIFVPLRGLSVPVPAAPREGAGGGLTSFGDRVLLLTHDGRFFAATADGAVEPAPIEPPPNGFEDYREASAAPPYDAYRHAFGLFRYNDVAWFDTASGRGLLVSTTHYHRDAACFTTTVFRASIHSEAAPVESWRIAAGDWRELFRTAPCLPLKPTSRAIDGHRAGGRLLVDAPRDRVLLASGDYHYRDAAWGPGATPEGALPLAQDPETDYGKILAIDLATGKRTVQSLGHRNVQGIATDREGRVFAVEHGPRGGDELNRITPGANYGWPLETYGTDYSGLQWPGAGPFGRHGRFTRPVFAWLPAIAPSGLARVEGFHEAWDGDLLVTTLRGHAVVRLRIEGERVVFAEKIPIGARVRDVHPHGDGTLVLWTDPGDLIFLTPAAGAAGAAFVRRFIDERLEAAEETKAAVRAALDECAECHAFDRGGDLPSLRGLLGARVGATRHARYSGALHSAGGVWTRERLDAFLADPQAAMPGTTMPDPHLDDPETRRAVVDVLDALTNLPEFD